MTDNQDLLDSLEESIDGLHRLIRIFRNHPSPEIPLESLVELVRSKLSSIQAGIGEAPLPAREDYRSRDAVLEDARRRVVELLGRDQWITIPELIAETGYEEKLVRQLLNKLRKELRGRFKCGSDRDRNGRELAHYHLEKRRGRPPKVNGPVEETNAE